MGAFPFRRGSWFGLAASTAAFLPAAARAETTRQRILAEVTLMKSIGAVFAVLLAYPGIVLIEDDVSSHVCRVQIDDLYFLAYANGNADRMRQLSPTIICVPSTDLTR